MTPPTTHPESPDRWAKPTPVDAVTMAFPASVVGTLLPPNDVIPEEFHRNWFNGGDVWTKTVNRWFGEGLSDWQSFKPKDGIEANLAWRHLKACMGSYEPKHEHKVAGVAWLMSRWFESPDEHGEKP
jgi:hypothetical protein